MSNIKLSLIFCCYNVSKYLDEIYKWLCEQPYQNIEVIFVEDELGLLLKVSFAVVIPS